MTFKVGDWVRHTDGRIAKLEMHDGHLCLEWLEDDRYPESIVGYEDSLEPWTPRVGEWVRLTKKRALCCGSGGQEPFLVANVDGEWINDHQWILSSLEPCLPPSPSASVAPETLEQRVRRVLAPYGELTGDNDLSRGFYCDQSVNTLCFSSSWTDEEILAEARKYWGPPPSSPPGYELTASVQKLRDNPLGKDSPAPGSRDAATREDAAEALRGAENNTPVSPEPALPRVCSKCGVPESKYSKRTHSVSHTWKSGIPVTEAICFDCRSINTLRKEFDRPLPTKELPEHFQSRFRVGGMAGRGFCEGRKR